MPRVLAKPKFKAGEEVVPFDSFTGTLDGEFFVINPSDVLLGEHPIVRAYPRMFRRRHDEQAQAAYWQAVNAAAREQRRRQEEEEQKRQVEFRAKIEKLADKLEPEVRKRREQARAVFGASSAETAEHKRKADEAQEERLRRELEERAAMQIVEERLAREANPN